MATNLTKSQTNGIARFRRLLELDIDSPSKDKYGAAITRFEQKEVSGLVFISAETELTKLPEGSLLRALDHHYWMAQVGERGAVTVLMAPQSYKQFNNKRTCQVAFKLF